MALNESNTPSTKGAIMPLTPEEINSESNAVIDRMSTWFGFFDEIRATPVPNEK